MDPKKITELANLLRNNGDKILNSEFKLTLSGFLLRALNDSFTLIADQSELCSPQSFQVVKPNNSKSDVFRDLQLVHDFVQKTIQLCITQIPDENFDGIIDITKFRNLKHLEVQKTNVKQLVGIQPLRAQLQQLICIRSLNCIEDIITHCGGDNSNGFVWNELKIADFSYNNLKTVDCSLEFAQYLQNLNLSHNQLVSVEAIKWLPNLKTLDLSFNRLSNIPVFHMETLKRLQLLNINNNFIEDLSGLSKLDSLTELDLSDNCLLDHNYLAPIATLMTLKFLSLYGNPLYCHPKHRLATAQFLHKNTSTVKFILDMEPLSKSEKLVTGRQQYFTGSLPRYPSNVGGQPIPGLCSVSHTPASSVGSLKSFKFNESDSIEVASLTNKIKKNPKVRMVIIEDKTIDQQKLVMKQQLIGTPLMAMKKSENNFMEGNKDHLEAKKQIEDVRDKFGAGWLQSENAPNVFAINTSEISEPYLIEKIKRTSTPMETENNSENNDTQLYETTKNYDFVSFKTIEENNISIKSIEKSNSLYHSTSNLLDVYANNPEKEEEISESEENEVTYIVIQNDNNQDAFLVVSDVSIKEKDVLTNRTKTKWSLKILESCDRVTSNTIRINFDTIKEDKKERVYIVGENLCQKLENYLRGILSQRELSEMNQAIYRCINCSCQFSREIKNKRFNIEIRCPECKSIFVVELEDQKDVKEKNEQPFDLTAKIKHEENDKIYNSTKLKKNTFEEKNNCVEEHSPQGSIGSAASLNESSSCSKITSNSDSSFDSNQSVAGSSSNERNMYANKNCDSDVEIISNPSVSSIEVLENLYSNRKTSEERRISQIPNLDTIHDQNILNQDENETINQEKKTLDSLPSTDVIVEKKTLLSHINLTESSSSGSVTDSICTAYEQGGDKSEESMLTGDSNRIIVNDQSIISSMLGGLFQSTNMLMSRTQKLTPKMLDESSCEKYKFNYVDFSDIDHRFKLYFYQTECNDENEHLRWIVKGQVFNERTLQLYESIVALSTNKLCVFEVIATEKDDVGKWLRQVLNVNIERFIGIELLPWNIGVSFKIQNSSGFLLILHEVLRTDTFLNYLEKENLPINTEIHYQQSDNVLKKLNFSTAGDQINILSVLNKCEVILSDNSSKIYTPSILFSTDNNIYLTNSNFSWLSKFSVTDIEIVSTQMMINVVDVEKNEINQFSIFYLDETQNTKGLWKCSFETKDSADSCLIAIGQSWEKLFGVPLFR